MKAIFIFLLLTSQSFAANQLELVLNRIQEKAGSSNEIPINFVCSTEHPTTSISVETIQKNVILRILHHNGLKFAPIHSGVITLHDIPYLEKKGGLFAQMGEHIVLEFDLNRCKKHQTGNYSCYNSNSNTIGALDVSSFGFQTYKTTSELYGMSLENFSFRFNVTVGNRGMNSTMEYFLPNDCIFR
ncbi:MAG: hypothetical protein KC493_17605 [Bacteriovoracaceae bacterium]|nr:hypothetical protein [Bacteriovoracaceae bacterium]